jgi:very-short-patch-repair endonuclease
VRAQTILDRAGGVASARTLRIAGVSRDEIDAALAARSIRRIRRGWYRSAIAHPQIVRAVEIGGALTCCSALAMQGVWMMPGLDLHVRVARGVALGPVGEARVHWSDRRQDHTFPMDSIAESLTVALRCLDQRAAVVALDSLLNRRLLARSDIESACGFPRGRRFLTLTDPASESGLETVARLALRRLQIRVTSQVRIPGVGRVDLVLGDRLVLELDGESWHDRPGDFDADRRRDRELHARGYLVLRASYRQVLTQWPEIEEQVLRIVRRGAHLWPRRRDGIRPRA